MVVHGHITLNGHKVDRPSYQVKVGMTIQVREKTLNTDFDVLVWKKPHMKPEYLESLAIQQVDSAPTPNDLPFDVDLHKWWNTLSNVVITQHLLQNRLRSVLLFWVPQQKCGSIGYSACILWLLAGFVQVLLHDLSNYLEGNGHPFSLTNNQNLRSRGANRTLAETVRQGECFHV